MELKLNFKLTLSLLLRLLLGGVFIFSGLIKLFPIEPFEYTLVDQGIMNWALAPYFSRFLISFETGLGLLLLGGFRLKNLSLPLVFISLICFTIYLGIDLGLNGNEGNCGCFGTFLEMTPLQSIYKNAILFLLSFVLFRMDFFPFSIKWKPFFLISFLSAAILVFVLNMPDAFYRLGYSIIDKKVEIDFSKLPRQTIHGAEAKPDSGKAVLAFFSTSCKHCKLVARKLSVLQNTRAGFRGFVYFWGEENSFEAFRKESGLNLPYVFYHNKEEFSRIIDGMVPVIFMVENGKVIKRWDRLTLDGAELDKLFR